MSDRFITIGQVLRPVGLRGEIKIRPLTDDVARFSKLRLVYIHDKPYPLNGMRIAEGFVFLKLSGVDSVEAAEELRSAFIEIDRVHAVPLPSDQYFIVDIIGCAVALSSGEEIGTVTDVMQAAGADVFTVTDGQRTVRFPFLKTLAHSVDTDQKRIVLDEKVFFEVSIYED